MVYRIAGCLSSNTKKTPQEKYAIDKFTKSLLIPVWDSLSGVQQCVVVAGRGPFAGCEGTIIPRNSFELTKLHSGVILEITT